MANKEEAPKGFKEMIGTKQKLGGGLFSSNKSIEIAEYDVLDWRFGSAQVMDMKTFKAIHPTVELLIKREGMRASRWTRGFACTSIDLNDEEE